MSNVLAISTVTAAFSRRLLAAGRPQVPNVAMRLGTPTAKLAEDGNALINLHLFRVEPNAFNANAHMPTRDGGGHARAPAQLALNLHYVVTFYGNHDDFETDRMLSAVLLAFEAEPVLSRKTLTATIEEQDGLEDSDLDEALARLRVTRQLHTIDDFSKIWSIFYQVPYAISLVYEVAHVLVEEDRQAQPALPVARPQNWVAPFSTLRLDAVQGSDGLAVWDGTLEVTGQGLAKPDLALELDGTALASAGMTVGAERIAVTLDAATVGSTLRAGLHRVQAVLPPRAGQPAHLAERSNTVAFALHPSLTPGAVNAPGGGDTASGDVTVTVSPPVASAQAVRLLLDHRDPATPGHLSVSGRDPEDDAADATELTFGFQDIPRGTYLVRVEVDGLVSPVTIDANTAEISGPEVTL